MGDQIKIAVLDDHRMFLEGVSMLVSSLDERYSVSNFHVPVELLKALEGGAHFDLIICDLIMDQMNGLAFVTAARSHTKKVPILMLSGINTSPPIAEMVSLGADGFVHKSSGNEILAEAVASLLSGKRYFGDFEPPKVDPYSGMDEADDALMIEPLPTLGKRQLEVLKMIAHGASNKEVSNTLEISENTVKSHLKQIFIALGVNKRTACIRKAQTLGLI